jgi:hypothetical protein
VGWEVGTAIFPGAGEASGRGSRVIIIRGTKYGTNWGRDGICVGFGYRAGGHQSSLIGLFASRPRCSLWLLCPGRQNSAPALGKLQGLRNVDAGARGIGFRSPRVQIGKFPPICKTERQQLQFQPGGLLGEGVDPQIPK